MGDCGNTGGGNTGGEIGDGKDGTNNLVAPIGEKSKTIFNNTSKLTKAQWVKVEKALENINSDCLGGCLLNELTKGKLTIVHNSTMDKNGSFSHSNHKLSIKDFKESDVSERTFERTLLHELLHSQQSGDATSKMNQEIEVRIAIYRYCLKHNIILDDTFNKNTYLLSYAIDERYNIREEDLFYDAYENYINELESTEYGRYPESSNARNLNTLQRLAKNC